MTQVLINDIRVDATTNETHASQVNITSHRVEDGADITDHARKDQDTLSMECWVSNTPLNASDDPYSDGAQDQSQTVDYEVPRRLNFNLFGVNVTVPFSQVLTQGNSPILGTETRTAVVNGFSSTFNRRVSVYDILQAFMEFGTILKVVTTLREYEDMLIESLSVPVTAGNADALQFTMNLRQVKFVQTGVANLPVPLLDAAKPKNRKGPAPTTEEDANSSKSDQVTSVLERARRTVAGVFGN